MKNRLIDLNNHLFAQLERLSDEALTPEQIETEAGRAKAIVEISDQIIAGANVQLKAAQIIATHGDRFKSQLTLITASGPDSPAATAPEQVLIEGKSQ